MAGLLSGCAAGGSSCVPLVPYDATTQRKALDELSLLPRDAVLPRFVEDYGELRARLRAMCGAG